VRPRTDVRIQPFNVRLRVYETDKLPVDTQALTKLSAKGVQVYLRPGTSREIRVHESVHAAFLLLDHVGVPSTADSHEALAYLVGYISGLVD
jgi:hypothetical protein